MRRVNNADAARRRLEAACARALDAVGREAAEGANRRAPVGETGRLSRSYDYRVEGRTLRVGSPLEYAACVELGTDKSPARPHLMVAAAEAAERLKE